MQLLAPVSILSFLAKAQGRLRPNLYRQVLTSPLVGVRPCSGVLWPWAVLCCCFGRGLSGVAPGALACRAVSLPSSGVVLGFRCGFETSRRPLYGSRFVTVSKHKRSFSLDKSVGSVLEKNWTHGQSASPDSAKATKLAKSLAW